MNKDECLKFGTRTTPGENIRKLCQKVPDNLSSVEQVLQILTLMAKEVPLSQNGKSKNKFRRTAEEICTSKDRNGCCDSSTLFVTMCREKGIPAYQIITAKLSALKQNDFGKGHFFSAFFMDEKNGWIIIDSNVNEKDINNGIRRYYYDKDKKFVGNDFIIIKELKDYSELEMNGVKINSIDDMHKVHQIFYKNYLKNNQARDDR